MIFAASENHEYVIELLLRQEDIDVNMEDTFKLKHSFYSNLTFFMLIPNDEIQSAIMLDFVSFYLIYLKDKPGSVFLIKRMILMLCIITIQTNFGKGLH